MTKMSKFLTILLFPILLIIIIIFGLVSLLASTANSHILELENKSKEDLSPEELDTESIF